MCVCSVFVSVPFESVAKIAPHVQYSKDLIQDEMTEITKARPEGRSMAAGSTSVTSLEAGGSCWTLRGDWLGAGRVCSRGAAASAPDPALSVSVVGSTRTARVCARVCSGGGEGCPARGCW